MQSAKRLRMVYNTPAMKEEPKYKNIATNRRARFEYEVLETYEAGLELTGTEVRSLRENNCQLTDCFCLIRGGEAWLIGVHIAPYSMGTYNNVDPDRKRKLLLHRRQIRVIEAQVKEKGMALVPLRMYFNEKSLVKVELGVARGKKIHDKRDSIQERDVQRDIDRAMKEHNRY